MKKKNRQTIWLALIFIIGVVICGLSIAAYFFLPSFKQVDFHTYFDISKNDVTLVVEDKRLTNSVADAVRNPVRIAGTTYFDFEFVKRLDRNIFWDSDERILTVTTLGTVMRLKPDEVAITVNMQPETIKTPIRYEENADRVLIPSDFIERMYHVTLGYNETFNVAWVDYRDVERRKAIVKTKKAALRYKPDKKSDIELQLEQSTLLIVYDTDGDFIRVRTAEGLLGYIKTSEIEITETIEKEPKPVETVTGMVRADRPVLPANGKIVMAWDQDFRMESVEGLNVIAPTWFTFDIDRMNGDIVSKADKTYVQWAHNLGYQVWALISDFSSDTSRSKHMDLSATILSKTSRREHVIKQLLNYADEYQLDGINIDFEYIQIADAEFYKQFFRELAPLCKQRGITLSVDMYNPMPDNYWSRYYNREEIGALCDYLCVMAYDEHTFGTESGPVASLPFVSNGLSLTLSEVPKEKVIMGMPFYVRIWREENVGGEIKNTIRNLGMDAAKRQFDEQNASWVYDAGYGCFYGEYEAVEDGRKVKYRTWLEDERSIKEKLEVFKKHDIAGVAGWKIGLESKGIWGLIGEYVR